MMSINGMKELIAALRARGYDEKTAQQYASLIGDTPEMDGAGKWVIRDEDGSVLATIDPIYES